jgi:hypothetical protein
MNIFIVFIGIIRPQPCFDYTNFKTSLFIKIINFNGIKKMAYLAMFVIFYVNMITCQISIYHTFIASLLKNSFFKMKNFKLITWSPNVIHII